VRIASLLLCILLLIAPRAAAALAPDELLLIVNGNVPASVRTAELYARLRLVPDGRIVRLNLPAYEEIPFDRYETEIVPTIRQFLREHALEDKVKCLVTFYGVPFRIGSKRTSSGEREEIGKLKEQQAQTLKKLISVVEQDEKLALKLNPKFITRSGNDFDELVNRGDAALQCIAAYMPRASDPQSKEIIDELIDIITRLGGDALLCERLSDEQAMAMLPPQRSEKWPQRRAEVEKLDAQMRLLQEKRYDPDSRQKLREISEDISGLYGLAAALRAQLGYLENDGTTSAVDNELALLWWNYYKRSSWQGNPLNFRQRGPHPKTLMVMRLDGPQEGSANLIILASLKAEREGLKGRVVIDSTGGTKPGNENDVKGGYKAYDEHLLHLADIVQKKTKLALTLDKRPFVMPANSARDVALYCGWYSVRNYVPACQFKPGAVGYHTASYEMISLHGDNEKGWVAGLLSDGIAATLGAVAEPYLASFPLPDEFFPLLMTGKLTLAEVYWKTTPMTSWMITCIGDPLYTPFKTNPVLKVEDLEGELRTAIEN
jgi:uncharacterized protein (TIGR03790 family)